MKFRVTMKDPDTLNDAIEEAVKAALAAIQGIDEDERETLLENRADAARSIASRWFKYSEYLTVEIDTEADTAVVVLSGDV